MNSVIKEMLASYNCKSIDDFENALKEIIQQIALLGLWRSKFFEVAAFYGGTALRILYGLDRFSEDMDFSLLAPSASFDISTYEASLSRELTSFGFDVKVERKIKARQTSIESAFIKANTLVHLIKINSNLKTQKDRLLQIKLEVDTDPPGREETEVVTVFNPLPFSVLTFTKPVLFSGKLAALLFRTRKTNVKGRDWYDFLWYVSKQTPCHLGHFTARLTQLGEWTHERHVSIEDVRRMVLEKIDSLDLVQAQKDVRHFARDPDIVDGWTKTMFRDAASKLTAANESKSL